MPQFELDDMFMFENEYYIVLSVTSDAYRVMNCTSMVSATTPRSFIDDDENEQYIKVTDKDVLDKYRRMMQEALEIRNTQLNREDDDEEEDYDDSPLEDAPAEEGELTEEAVPTPAPSAAPVAPVSLPGRSR